MAEQSERLGARVPRIRGDDPEYNEFATLVGSCSPHTRG